MRLKKPFSSMDYDKALKEIKERAISFILTILYPTILIYAYYVLVGIFCLEEKEFATNYVLSVFIVYHLLLFYTIIFYLRLFPVEGVSTKDLFYAESEFGEKNYEYVNPYVQEAVNKRNSSQINVCLACQIFKPPRAHHCKKCNKCYLKMDHHCYAINTCIAFHNYKFFILYLASNFLMSGYVFGTILYNLLAFNLKSKFVAHYIVLISLIGANGVISLIVFIFHCVLLGRNETTIENLALNMYIFSGDLPKKDTFQEGPLAKNTAHLRELSAEEAVNRSFLNPYCLSRFDNFRQVFGDNPAQWFLPTFSSWGDGISFPRNSKDAEADEEAIIT